MGVVAAMAVATVLHLAAGDPAQASSARSGLGLDIDYYTGPISRDSWLRMKRAGEQFAVVQAWGGRSRNEFAVSHLTGARLVGRMKTATYLLLNYDDKDCATYAAPVRDLRGRCRGDLIDQPVSGARWQVQQAFASLGDEAAHVAFVAVDVEWFLDGAPPTDDRSLAQRRASILDALDEIARHRKASVIYTRNGRRHWRDITGCDTPFDEENGCVQLRSAITNPRHPIPLWDVETGTPNLRGFHPHGAWTSRAGRQYELDRHLFGLPPHRTVDLDVFDASLFAPRDF